MHMEASSMKTDWGAMVDRFERGVELIPVGTVCQLVITHFRSHTSAAGNYTIIFTATVVGGPWTGKEVRHTMVAAAATEYTLKRFFLDAMGLGIDLDFFRAQPGAEEVANRMMGCRFEADISVIEYNGAHYNSFQNIRQYQGD